MEWHEWVSDPTISMQENEVLVALNSEIDVPCVVQWRPLCFSLPSRPKTIADNGTIFAKYHLEDSTRQVPVESAGVVLDKSTDKVGMLAGDEGMGTG